MISKSLLISPLLWLDTTQRISETKDSNGRAMRILSSGLPRVFVLVLSICMIIISPIETSRLITFCSKTMRETLSSSTSALPMLEKFKQVRAHTYLLNRLTESEDPWIQTNGGVSMAGTKDCSIVGLLELLSSSALWNTLSRKKPEISSTDS